MGLDKEGTGGEEKGKNQRIPVKEPHTTYFCPFPMDKIRYFCSPYYIQSKEKYQKKLIYSDLNVIPLLESYNSYLFVCLLACLLIFKSCNFKGGLKM